MRRSSERILTTHAGSLPRPAALLARYAPRRNARVDVEDLLGDSVRQVVARQLEAGIDIVNDGEFGKPTETTSDDDHGHAVWAWYVGERLAGMQNVEADRPIRQGKDRTSFQKFYDAASQRRPVGPGRVGQAGERVKMLTCTGPLSYHGHTVVSRDISNLGAALGAHKPGDAFLPVVSPASISRMIPDRHYGDQEQYRSALADALREEYLAIVQAGYILQIDDPVLVCAWDWWPDSDVGAYLKVAAADVALLNHALRGIPPEQVRYHLCWGSWQGPHSSDLPLRDIVELLLEVRAGAYVVEAANPRHEHEWKVWREVELPEDRLLVPGVVTHKTSVVEDPEVVADRLLRYAEVVGRERVIAGTDCGMGGRISSDVAWAKLTSLATGARLASERLWR